MASKEKEGEKKQESQNGVQARDTRLRQRGREGGKEEERDRQKGKQTIPKDPPNE